MNKPTLLLLHGALGSKKQMLPLAELLATDFDVHALNFVGHGGRELPEKYTCELFAEDIIEFISQLPQKKLPINIFGYSMGGYVGAYLALHYPEKINKVFALATKFAWDAESGAIEINKLNIDKLKEKAPALCKALEQEHAPENWETLVNKTRDMMTAFTQNPPLKDSDLALIQQKVTVALGDRDKTADLKNSIAVYSKLPKGKLLVLPNTGHLLEKVDLKVLEPFVLAFFNTEITGVKGVTQR